MESPIRDYLDDHGDCKNVCCAGPPVVRAGGKRTPDCDPGHAGCVCCFGVPGGMEGLRRSERARTPTRRFEESWYKGELRSLGDALSSDEE